MEAKTPVRRRDDVAALAAPRLDDAVDRAGIEVGAVGEHDDCGFDVGGQRLEAAAKRGAGPELPVRAVHDLGVGVDAVCPGDDEHAVERGRTPQRSEHVRQQLLLLGRRRAVSRRGPGSQDDRKDHVTPSSQLSNAV